MKQRTVSFHTLGCKLNFSETSTISRQFNEGGFARVSGGEVADICVVNTCSVTEHADKKCRNIIRKLIRTNPNAIIAVTGCYAQLKPQEVASIKGVDIVASNNDKALLFQHVVALGAKGKSSIYGCDTSELTNFFAAFSTSDRTRAFLKVQDGCDYRCTYCTLPNARGASRNISIADLVAQAFIIAASGVKEIVLTGINTGDFGRTTGETFHALLSELSHVKGIERYRISSIEPNLLTDEIIALMACCGTPHFHIPLQSGSDRILGLMRRRYTTATFSERIAAVRRVMANAFIGIDVIVGFPGESDEDFMATYRFLESVAPSFIHVFPYSERANTPAIDFPGKVSSTESSRRVKRLRDLSDRLHREFCSSFVGTTAEVLFEPSARGGMMSGYTPNYIKVAVPYDKSRLRTIATVTLETMDENGTFVGQII